MRTHTMEAIGTAIPERTRAKVPVAAFAKLVPYLLLSTDTVFPEALSVTVEERLFAKALENPKGQNALISLQLEGGQSHGFGS